MTQIAPRVALYGGAFDPPHLAHVFTLTWLLQLADVDEIWVLPAASHVFGKRMSPFEARLAMLQAVLDALGSPRIRICTIETELPGTGRTFDTLSALQARHPDHAFRLVLGADNLSEADRWYRFDDLVARWPVIALGRPGHEATLARCAREPWCTPGPTLPAVSSTRLRAALRGGGDEEATRWLPEVCWPWARDLYREPVAAGPSVWIFGAGRTGRVLAAALQAGGVEVRGVWNRSERPDATQVGDLPADLSADVWILAVSDPAITPLATRLAAHPQRPAVALHCAGRLDHAALAPLAGVALGSLHPLQALGDDPGALRGAFCGIEGDDAAREAAVALVRAFGGQAIQIPAGEKAAWHAAAVISANFVATLTGGGVALLAALGIDEAQARALLVPLLRGTIGRLQELPAPEALTGPLARADLGAVAAHVAALHRHAPLFLPAYQALAATTARWLGWDAGQVTALAEALTPPT